MKQFQSYYYTAQQYYGQMEVGGVLHKVNLSSQYNIPGHDQMIVVSCGDDRGSRIIGL